MQYLLNLATAEPETASGGILQALGIDGKLLVEQAIAFLILVFLLSKFVYPVLIKTIDSRKEQLESSAEEARKAEEAASSAEERIEKMLDKARKEADEVVARAHHTAQIASADIEEKAKARAERIAQEAHEQLDRDIEKARKLMRKDMVELVALATEKIVKEKIDSKKDSALIAGAIEENRS